MEDGALCQPKTIYHHPGRFGTPGPFFYKLENHIVYRPPPLIDRIRDFHSAALHGTPLFTRLQTAHTRVENPLQFQHDEAANRMTIMFLFMFLPKAHVTQAAVPFSHTVALSRSKRKRMCAVLPTSQATKATTALSHTRNSTSPRSYNCEHPDFSFIPESHF